MALARLELTSRRPYHGGATFGDTGAYERLDGVAYFAVDPALPGNQAIVDLEKADRGAAGRVLFSADFCMLQPIEAGRGNGRLLFDVVNRGQKRANARFNRTALPAQPTERIGPGDGFLMRRGWSLVWCGWQWDVIRSPALLGLEAPRALAGGRPVEGRVMVELQFNERASDHVLADRAHQPYPAADPADPEAELTVRDWPDGTPVAIPRSRWQFAHDENGRAVSDPTHVRLEGGFDPGRIYQVSYRTIGSPVAGAGFLAVRDAVSFLRYGGEADGNPSAGRIERAYAFGVSQSGRFLRHFLYLGLNLDEQGRQVFDGILPLVAGARRGEFNERFAQPSRSQVPGFGHMMPFTDDDQTDHLTGRTDGLLRRQRALGGVPRIVALNSAAEYWRADCSLMHTDIAGQHDIEPPDETRVYHLAGTQHMPGELPLGRGAAGDSPPGMHNFNTVDYTPLLRAALVNLDTWVSGGQAPPPSVYPRLSDHAAASRSDVIARFESIPSASRAIVERMRSMRRVDLGPEAAEGIAHYPAKLAEPYPTLVSAVDADGNEVGGVRLPDISVPLATYMGWNPRDPATGGEGQILDMLGSTLPFARTAAERTASKDPRPSIEERYRDRNAYLAQVREAAEALAADRYLLAEDVDLVVDTAAQRYDAFAVAPEVAAAPADGG
jgi:hypothetical protein